MSLKSLKHWIFKHHPKKGLQEWWCFWKTSFINSNSNIHLAHPQYHLPRFVPLVVSYPFYHGIYHHLLCSENEVPIMSYLPFFRFVLLEMCFLLDPFLLMVIFINIQINPFLFPRDAGSPKLRMVSWKLNIMPRWLNIPIIIWRISPWICWFLWSFYGLPPW